MLCRRGALTGLLVYVVVSLSISPGGRPLGREEVLQSRGGRSPLRPYPQRLTFYEHKPSTAGRGSFSLPEAGLPSEPAVTVRPVPLLVTVAVLVSRVVTEVSLGHADGGPLGVHTPTHVGPGRRRHVFRVSLLLLPGTLLRAHKCRLKVVLGQTPRTPRPTCSQPVLLVSP